MKEKISFNKFKALTKHKKVSYFYLAKKSNGELVRKDFETDKFYCNKYKDQLSLPRFILSAICSFFQIDKNTFKHESEFGETYFKVLN